MKKFDPIDIFFIALITTYFITLLCIGITFLCKCFNRKKEVAEDLNASEVSKNDDILKKNIDIKKKDKKRK